MANTFTHLNYHFIWSTKNRDPIIHQSIETRIWGLIGSMGANEKEPAKSLIPIRIGGVEDHVHVAVSIPKTVSVSKAAQILKGGSSTIINRENLIEGRFEWQDGYAAYTVSRSQLDTLKRYIVNQREHHRAVTFEEEYRALLDKHGVDYDEKYLFG